jgi:hypothetical protein
MSSRDDGMPPCAAKGLAPERSRTSSERSQYPRKTAKYATRKSENGREAACLRDAGPDKATPAEAAPNRLCPHDPDPRLSITRSKERSQFSPLSATFVAPNPFEQYRNIPPAFKLSAPASCFAHSVEDLHAATPTLRARPAWRSLSISVSDARQPGAHPELPALPTRKAGSTDLITPCSCYITPCSCYGNSAVTRLRRRSDGGAESHSTARRHSRG